MVRGARSLLPLLQRGGGDMTTRTAETSPLVYARVAGFLVILLVFLGPFSQLYVPSTLIVPGDATATADNIRASGWVFRLGIVSDSLVFLIEIVLTVTSLRITQTGKQNTFS